MGLVTLNKSLVLHDMLSDARKSLLTHFKGGAVY